MDEPSFGSSQRLKLNTTSSASSARGLGVLKIGPFRTTSVHVFKSSDALRLSSKWGRGRLCSSTSVRNSAQPRTASDAPTVSTVAGSTSGFSVSVLAYRNVPPRLGTSLLCARDADGKEAKPLMMASAPAL